MTGCAQGPARWYYVVVGTRKFGRAWVSTEGAKATAARAAAINVTVSAKRQSANQADSRSAAATAAGAALVTAVGLAAVPAVVVAMAAASVAVALVAAAVFEAAAVAECLRRSWAKAKGIVKFFNPQKGFGFIVRDDGGEDVFVHISAVEQAGLTDLADGQPLEFTLVDRGGRISATNLRIEGEPMAVERSGGSGGAGGDRGPQRQLTGEKASGTVKFFNAMKGFGFIQRDDGQPDAFVHISAVERAGIPTLNEGDRLEFEIEVDRRGKYAAVNLQPLT